MLRKTWFIPLAVSSLIMVSGMHSPAALSSPYIPQASSTAAVNQVNLNLASAEELALNLTGVGIKRAQAIVELREKLGGFSDIKQLLQVKGIGPRMLELNQDRITF